MATMAQWHEPAHNRATGVRARHPHYHKSVAGLRTIDVYRVLKLFDVADPCLQHAVKKLLVAGGRGAGKDVRKDVQEAVDSLVRWQEMREEEEDSVRQPATSFVSTERNQP